LFFDAILMLLSKMVVVLTTDVEVHYFLESSICFFLRYGLLLLLLQELIADSVAVLIKPVFKWELLLPWMDTKLRSSV
jgi:hypothetical protein